MMFRLKVFLSVASHLSFTKASEELYISQPAISKHISELEKIYQVRLFSRDKGRIRLTREGEIFRENALVLMEDYNKLEGEMRLLRGSVGGRLRLGASTTIAQYLIAPILAGFKSRFTQVDVSLVTGNTEAIESAIAEQKIDLGLVEGDRHRGQLKYST
ncbi:MAG: LysR family transcriptional regulator, partial [Candidatus Cryptobacteroides sp.]